MPFHKSRFFRKTTVQAISGSKYFNAKWYKARYPEAASSGLTPGQHYCEIGWRKGYDPSPDFSTEKYLKANQDVADLGINPLEHYIRFGQAEGRTFQGMVFRQKRRSLLDRIGARKRGDPLISVIVASYNYENLIKETLDSLLAQTYKNFEAIIVDDGSKDNSVEVIKEYARKYPNFKLFQHEGGLNKGLHATVKLGIEKSTGDYVAFLESDDIWTPNHLEKKAEIIRNYRNVGFISNDLELIGETDNAAKNTHMSLMRGFWNESPKRLSYFDMRRINRIPTFSVVMARRDLLKGLNFDSPIPAWLDLWLWCQRLGHKWFYVDEKLTYWRIHESLNNSYASLRRSILKQGVFRHDLDLMVLGRPVGRRKIDFRYAYKRIKASGLFDEEYYKAQCPEAAKRGFDPLAHYMEYGWGYGFDPSENFLGDEYLRYHTDIVRNPLVHYVMHGQAEGRIRFGKDLKRETILPKGYKPNPSGKNVLLVSHLMDYTGAPMALLNVAKILKEAGHNPYILAPAKGALAERILKDGIPVIYDANLFAAGAVPKFDMPFDLAICNTSVLFSIYENLSKAMPTLWWIHEMLDAQGMSGEQIKVLGSAKNIIVPSAIINEYLGKYGAKGDVLAYPIEDRCPKPSFSRKAGAPVRFACIGSIDKRKNQELLLEAAAKLPASLRKLARFELVGDLERPSHYLKTLMRKADGLPVEFLPIIKDAKAYNDYLDGIDAVVCPSLLDPLPIVITEGMMHGKIPIVSTKVGHKDMITNGKDGFGFESGNSDALSAILADMIKNRGELAPVKKAARALFVKNFDMAKTRKAWLSRIN